MRIPFVGSRATTLVAFVLCTAALACGGSGSSSDSVTGPGSGSPPPPPVNTSTTALTVTNNHFTPSRDSVAAGSTLQWTWNSCTGDIYGGSECTSHSVQFDDAGPSSPIKSSGSFSRTFADAGTYTYHCAVHGAAMSGTIIVH